MALAPASRATAELQLPPVSGVEPVAVNAQWGNRWQAGTYEVWVLGNCEIRQGKRSARGREAVLWIQRTEPTDPQPSRVAAYLEGNVEVVADGPSGRGRLTDQTWYGEFETSAGVGVQAAAVYGKPDVLPPVYQRGQERRNPAAGQIPQGDSPLSAAGKSGPPPAYAERQVQWAAPAPGAGPAPAPAANAAAGYQTSGAVRAPGAGGAARRPRGGSASFPVATCPSKPNGSPIPIAGSGSRRSIRA